MHKESLNGAQELTTGQLEKVVGGTLPSPSDMGAKTKDGFKAMSGPAVPATLNPASPGPVTMPS